MLGERYKYSGIFVNTTWYLVLFPSVVFFFFFFKVPTDVLVYIYLESIKQLSFLR